MNIGRAISELRREMNIKQGELAKKCNISHVELAKIEMGKIVPHPETIESIAKGLGVPIWGIIVRADEIDR